MPHSLGDAPIEPQFIELMNELARTIDIICNGELKGKDRKVGFILITFPFGDEESRCNYISNADRRDVVIMLKEQLKRFEGQPEIKGRA